LPLGNRLQADATAAVESWRLSVERCVVKDCIALLIAWSVFSVQTVQAGPTKTILVLGDSLSQGFGLASNEAYPMLLAKKLRAAGLNFQVTNASAAGGTTKGCLERLPAHLKRKIDIFILELGINDAFRGMPVDQIQNNLQQIIDKVKTRNPQVRVVIAGCNYPIIRPTIMLPPLARCLPISLPKMARRSYRISCRAWQAIHH